MRLHTILLFGLTTFLVAQAGVLASVAVARAATTLPLSRIGFNATLPIADVRSKLRDSAVAAFLKSPPAPVSAERDGVSVTVTPTVLAKQLGLSARANGVLDVSVPISISVDVQREGIANLVGIKGCETKTFTVGARFDPQITPTGGLRFSLGHVSVRPGGYQCGLYVILQVEDIAARILARLEDLGETAFETRLRDFNALLPNEDELLDMLGKPAQFGSALVLGIDSPGLRITQVAASGDVYRISGYVEGYPRLRFGADWMAREVAVGQTPAEAGFRLPARLLFPTDPSLLPDASVYEASACLGAFRLQSVPNRPDMAVLRRCGPDAGTNVIWLSGANEAPPLDRRLFNRSMSDLLTGIVHWLDDPTLWSGVDGIAALRQEVNAFRELLAMFQQETTIPVDMRGSLRFFDLDLDLLGVWVNPEAIHADVVLTGKANLAIELSL